MVLHPWHSVRNTLEEASIVIDNVRAATGAGQSLNDLSKRLGASLQMMEALQVDLETRTRLLHELKVPSAR
jgi:hypothetical protein